MSEPFNNNNFKNLSQTQQQILLLRYVDNKSLYTIARLLSYDYCYVCRLHRTAVLKLIGINKKEDTSFLQNK